MTTHVSGAPQGMQWGVPSGESASQRGSDAPPLQHPEAFLWHSQRFANRKSSTSAGERSASSLSDSRAHHARVCCRPVVLSSHVRVATIPQPRTSATRGPTATPVSTIT